ncbi:Ketohexokinase [Toxocara canis]|uniref:Ketohexokinase n=1 Tax=Toxocara canis TaxID=6265 RepID=A0A0B2VTM7_TOXCA|nr:Ketohexokinase [Toxocara canis]
MAKNILVVGLTCIDVVNYVNSYPLEDSDNRVMKQVWSLGGNAANNVTVLNQLNSHTTLFSALPADNSLVNQCRGFTDKESAVDGIRKLFGVSRNTIICPWAEKGAAGRACEESRMVSVEAFTAAGPAVDTLAAGDCFIACCIHWLSEGYDLEQTLTRACRITGKKVAKRGLLALDIT